MYKYIYIYIYILYIENIYKTSHHWQLFPTLAWCLCILATWNRLDIMCCLYVFLYAHITQKLSLVRPAMLILVLYEKVLNLTSSDLVKLKFIWIHMIVIWNYGTYKCTCVSVCMYSTGHYIYYFLVRVIACSCQH